MSRILSATRYLIIIPIIGLAIAASFFFIFGGIGLVRLLVELLLHSLNLGGHQAAQMDNNLIIFEVVEFVHRFLIGTVIYITAIGLYQLFIHEIELPKWLKVENIEELETNLIGVTVVVLAVNFMGAVFVGSHEDFLSFGAGIGIVVASLALFIGLRSWSSKRNKEPVVLGKETHTENNSAYYIEE